MICCPPVPTLFPYTTLFRSVASRYRLRDNLETAPSLAHFRATQDWVRGWCNLAIGAANAKDRKSTRLNSSHITISYAVFCLKKKTTRQKQRFDSQQAMRHPL